MSLLTVHNIELLLVSSEEPDGEYKVLPWKAAKEEIKHWLIDQGYGG